MNEVNKWRHLCYVVFKDGQRSQVAPRGSCQGHHNLIDELHTVDKDGSKHCVEKMKNNLGEFHGGQRRLDRRPGDVFDPPSFLSATLIEEILRNCSPSAATLADLLAMFKQRIFDRIIPMSFSCDLYFALPSAPSPASPQALFCSVQDIPLVRHPPDWHKQNIWRGTSSTNI